MKLKICGMKYHDNILAVAGLQPDYLGFIFYKNSKRNFVGTIPILAKNIRKVGVFVNESIETILKKIKEHQLNSVQLHGDESAEFCKALRTAELRLEKKENYKPDQIKFKIIKAFSVGNIFDFRVLQSYEAVCDYFLFDTKGKERGGNGEVFNWKILEGYPFEKPYLLSGGIGLDELENLNKFLKSNASEHCYAIDVNSKFEMKPGLKNVEKLRSFIQKLEN